MQIFFRQSGEDYSSLGGLLLANKLTEGLPIFQKNCYQSINQKRRNSIDYNSCVKGIFGLQCLGEPIFASIERFNRDTLFRDLITGGWISQETFRQKLNVVANKIDYTDLIDRSVINLLRFKIIKKTWFGGREYYTLDMDVTPFINEGVKKEGISCTYKKKEGFAPMMAYIGEFAIAFELRPGNQHSEKGAIDFLSRCISITDRLGIARNEILLRVDSAHDCNDFLQHCIKLGINFVIKRNIRNKKSFLHDEMPRIKLGFMPEETSDPNIFVYRAVDKGKKIYNVQDDNLNIVYEFSEKLITGNNIQLDFNFDRDSDIFGREPWFEYDVDSYLTNIKIYDNSSNECLDQSKYCIECVDIYHDHATSEQYHSEIKSGMNMELLPSKYFKTNDFILKLCVISFNVLRLIGNMTLDIDSSFQHHNKECISRINVRTVINSIINVACRIVKHARKIIVKFGRNFYLYRTFEKLFYSIK